MLCKVSFKTFQIPLVKKKALKLEGVVVRVLSPVIE